MRYIPICDWWHQYEDVKSQRADDQWAAAEAGQTDPGNFVWGTSWKVRDEVLLTADNKLVWKEEM